MCRMKGGTMKRLLMCGALCLLGACLVRAETLSGKVTDVGKNMVTVRTNDGEKMTLGTTDNTRYREKKVSRKGKMKKGKISSADASFRPMVEEDDWVEITYTPANNEMQSAEIQEVIVYDD